MLAVAACQSRGGTGRPPATDAAAQAPGAALYERHCAACHGLRGDADTPVAALLFPRPRAFRDGLFKLASTQNGMPTDDDLVRTLHRGMPGSAMPGYAWMTEMELHLLARHVRTLATEGVERALLDAPAGAAMTPAERRAAAEQRLRPGPPVPVPDFGAAAGAPARGEVIYQRHCSACHGPEGTGRAPHPLWAGSAEFHWARDFTSGVLRGAPTASELTWRVRAGMPGAGMPPTELADAELVDLVAYVQSLIPEAAAERHLQQRRQLRAVRVPALPGGVGDPAWEQIEPMRLPVAPLWWRPDAVLELWLRAAHDGERIAFQLGWQDATRDDRAFAGAPQGDGVALQFTVAADPPMFAMGQGEPVDIWFYRTFHPGDVAGALDVIGGSVHQMTDVPPVLPGVTGPVRRGESLVVRGPADMAVRRGSGLELLAEPVWRDGRWTVVLTRAMAPRAEDAIPLPPGGEVLVAAAVWDGSVDPYPGSKSVTAWHALAIDP